MWLADLLRSRIPHLAHPLELQLEKRGSLCVQDELSCGEEACKRSGRKGAEQDVCETSNTKKNDGTEKKEKANKEESKNDGFTARSIIYDQDLIGKLLLLPYHRPRSWLVYSPCLSARSGP